MFIAVVYKCYPCKKSLDVYTTEKYINPQCIHHIGVGKKMDKWLNSTKRIWKADEIEKPCHSCGFCVYGQLVEEFPLGKKRDEYSCNVFGHDCPVFYHAELIKED